MAPATLPTSSAATVTATKPNAAASSVDVERPPRDRPRERHFERPRCRSPAIAAAEKPTAKTEVRMMAIGWMKPSAIEPGRLKMSPPPNLRELRRAASRSP